MYDYIIFTHIPVFYKVNLYNELNKKLNIYVIFIAAETNEKRSLDFIDKSAITFDYEILSTDSFQSRDKLNNLRKITEILRLQQFKKVLVSGWDLIEFWCVIFFVAKRKNCLALESTVFESRSNRFRGVIKKLFLFRISCVFASGSLHKKLLEALNYGGEIRITKGVGIIKKPFIDKVERHYRKKYLYVGRLSEEKNLFFLVELFNTLPDFDLTIIGIGSIESKLKELANDNIQFCGQVNNKDLKKFYYSNDLLILPSIREPWGLVVDEALYFGMPVIISDKCGACELIDNGVNGFIFEHEEQLKEIIIGQCGESYLKLTRAVKKFSLNVKDQHQVDIYDGR